MLLRSRAGPRASTIRPALCALAALLVTGCEWQPIARPVDPQRMIEGPARIDHALDSEARYVLVQVGPSDALGLQIANTEKRTACTLPAGSEAGWEPLRAPNLHGENVAAFLLPLLQRNADDVTELYFVDEKCQVSPSFGLADGQPDLFTLHADGRQVALVVRPERALNLVDPWTGEIRVIAQDVRGRQYAAVKQSAGAKAEDALWVVDGGKLRKRALDGTLLLSLGSDVARFQQTLIYDKAPLRVAYEDGDDLYEAAGPDFVPVLIAEGACRPRYVNDTLELFVPCSPSQLVRIQLTTGEIERFAPGVTSEFTLGALKFEVIRGDDGDQVWMSAKSGQRIRLDPAPVGSFALYGDDRIVGRTGDDRLGVWDLSLGFITAFRDVQEISTFRDTRTGRLTWLMLHEAAAGTGELAVLGQDEVDRALAGPVSITPTPLAQQVPSSGMYGYRVLTLGSVDEPLVLTLEAASPVEYGEPEQEGEAPVPLRYAGRLHARVLSNELESAIDNEVSSFTAVFAPLPGVLYGITEGPTSGLWFAAL